MISLSRIKSILLILLSALLCLSLYRQKNFIGKYNSGRTPVRRSSAIVRRSHHGRLKHENTSDTGNTGDTGERQWEFHYDAECRNRLKELWDTPVKENLTIPSKWSCIFPTGQETPATLGIHDIVRNEVFQDVFQCPIRAANFSKTKRRRVALASFPGSGNTWARHILEQASGIYTGSVYCGVVKKTFIAECQRKMNNFTIAIKTHSRRLQTIRNFSAAIVIIRYPLDAAFAEYNRKHSGKTKTINKDNLHSDALNTSLYDAVPRWFDHGENWLKTFDKPVHILVYENLKTDLLGETYKMMSFLKVKVTYGDLWCLLKNSEGAYLRKKPPGFSLPLTKILKYYTEEYVQPIRTLVHRRFNITLPF